LRQAKYLCVQGMDHHSILESLHWFETG